MENNNIWFNYSKIFSFPSILNIIIGERGVGKTYGITKEVIKKYLNKGQKFVYVRRYKTELKTSAQEFFSKVIENNEFPSHELTYKPGKTVGHYYIDDELCGYSIPLSTSLTLKSSNFINVKYMIFDEFLIEQGVQHYLKNEPELLLHLIESVFRFEDFKAFLLANATSTSNPYFTYFNLALPYGKEYKLFKNNLILLYYIKNENYRKAKRKSKLGQLIAGTAYEKHAIDNQFYRDSDYFIEKMSGNCYFMFNLLHNNVRYGVWLNDDQKVFINKKFNETNDITIALTSDDHNQTTFTQRSRYSFYWKLIVESFRDGKLFFHNKKIKSELFDIINKYY